MRKEDRLAQVSVVVATAVNADGKREVLGIDVGRARTARSGWRFLRRLVARGLSGVELGTSGAHQGLREDRHRVRGGTSWQRRRTHFMRNILTRVPKSADAPLTTTERTIFQQPSAEAVHAQHARVVDVRDTWSATHTVPSSSCRRVNIGMKLRSCEKGCARLYLALSF